ncbi:MAG: TolC family protein [Acidobacteriia bacterium]|nr:TolC family protein [Terriglobia bacterium]
MGIGRLIRPEILLPGTLLATMLYAGDLAEQPALTLEQAVALAVERNPKVLIASERTEMLKGKIKEVRADALPFLRLNGSGMRWRDPSFLNSPSFDKIPPEFLEALQVAPANLFDYNLSISQPLYTSGKVGTALKLASLESEGTGVDRDRAEQDTRLAVIKAFYGLLLAQGRLEAAQETVREQEKSLEIVRGRYAAGVAMEVDVLRSQVSLANAQPDLIRADNGVRLARTVLNNLLVRPLDFPTEAVGRLAFEPQASKGLEEVVRSAYAHRPELQRARINEREAEGQQKLANAENRLRLDFNGQYGVNSRLPSHLFNHEFTRFMFTVNVGLPLFDGGRRSGLLQQAVANRKVAELTRIDTENSVRLEAQTALDELARAEKTVEAARLNVKQAERVLTMMQGNYRYGAATTLDVLQAETALSVARLTLLQGLYDHTIARAHLGWVMGLDPVEQLQAATKPEEAHEQDTN